MSLTSEILDSRSTWALESLLSRITFAAMVRPGSLHPRFRTVAQAEETAAQVVAVLGSPWLNKAGSSKMVPRPAASAVLQAGRLLDWFTVRQIPLSPIALKALMCALRVESHVRSIEAAAEARAWEGQKSALEIARLIGFSRAQVFELRKKAPSYPEWASDEEVIAAARTVASHCQGFRGERDRYPTAKGALVIYSALRRHALEGRPLTEGLWWCALCGMGLADYSGGLLDCAIEGTNRGRRFPDALRLLARWDAECDFAGEPRLSDAEALEELQKHYALRHMARLDAERDLAGEPRLSADESNLTDEALLSVKERELAGEPPGIGEPLGIGEPYVSRLTKRERDKAWETHYEPLLPALQDQINRAVHREVPERATVVSYRGSADYERHVTDHLTYVRRHRDRRTAMEKQKAWHDLVEAVKAEDAALADPLPL